MNRTKYIHPTPKSNLKVIENILCEMAMANRQHRPKKWKRFDKKLYRAQQLQIQLEK